MEPLPFLSPWIIPETQVGKWLRDYVLLISGLGVGLRLKAGSRLTKLFFRKILSCFSGKGNTQWVSRDGIEKHKPARLPWYVCWSGSSRVGGRRDAMLQRLQ
jgi:hypothetical protein